MPISVAQWLSEHPGHTLAVAEATSLDELLQQVNRYPEVQDLYVIDQRAHVVGHISKHRFANNILAEHSHSHSRRHLMERVFKGSAGELMERHFPTAALDEDLDSVIQRMLEHQLHDLAVLNKEGGLAGTVSLTELLRSFT